MSAWLAARKLLLDRIAAAEARELSEQEFQRPAEVQSDATLNVHPASSSNTPAASVVATSAAASMIATSDIVASSTIWACTTSNASSVTAATSAAETVTSETIEEAAVSLWSANDESNFDTSANRSRRWRHQNVLKARDQNVNGQVRRKQREQQDQKLRERRREQVRECRERDREAARRVGLKPSDQRWKERKAAQWQRKQQQSEQRAKAEVRYFYSNEYMVSKTARHEAPEQLPFFPPSNSSLLFNLLCNAADTNAAADPEDGETLLALPACASNSNTM